MRKKIWPPGTVTHSTLNWLVLGQGCTRWKVSTTWGCPEAHSEEGSLPRRGGGQGDSQRRCGPEKGLMRPSDIPSAAQWRVCGSESPKGPWQLELLKPYGSIPSTASECGGMFCEVCKAGRLQVANYLLVWTVFKIIARVKI